MAAARRRDFDVLVVWRSGGAFRSLPPHGCSLEQLLAPQLAHEEPPLDRTQAPASTHAGKGALSSRVRRPYRSPSDSLRGEGAGLVAGLSSVGGWVQAAPVARPRGEAGPSGIDVAALISTPCRTCKREPQLGKEEFMALVWDSKLSVGVPVIDKQHQELFRQVNALLEALGQGTGRKAVGDLLTFLKDYVVEHFSTEQKLMAQHSYPQLAPHKKQHDDFVKAFMAAYLTFEKDGATVSLTVTVNRLVCTWLREHIGTTDKALGDFIVTRGARLRA